MSFDEYKVVLNRNQPWGWVAEIPAISGCYALMATKTEALSELQSVLEMIEEDFKERGEPLPADSIQIVHA